MKRAYCLYRVSTKNQVDVQKDDIPMQKIACHEFAKAHGCRGVHLLYRTRIRTVICCSQSAGLNGC